MTYIQVSSQKFQAFKNVVKPLLDKDLVKQSVDELREHIKLKINETLSDKYIESLRWEKGDKFQEGKLNILCKYYDFESLDEVFRLHQINIPQITTDELSQERTIVLARIQERLEYYRLYDFDNQDLAKLCHEKYKDTLWLCEQASHLGMDFFQEVVNMKEVLVSVSSDLFCFEKAKQLRNELRPVLKYQYGLTPEYAKKIYNLDIYTFSDLKAHICQYTKAKEIHQQTPIKALYALNRLGFGYLIEEDYNKAGQIFQDCEEMFQNIENQHTSVWNRLYQEAYITFYKGFYLFRIGYYLDAYTYLKKALENFIVCFGTTQHYVGISSYLLWKTTQHIKGRENEISTYLEKTRNSLLGYHKNKRFWIFETKKSDGDGFGYYGEFFNKTKDIYNEIS